MIKLLAFYAGADASRKVLNGWSAILDACMQGHLSTVELLIHHDNDLLEFAETNCGWTPLIAAIRQRHSDIVRFLLKSGADANHVSRNGATALVHACIKGSSLETVRLLLDAGVHVEARDERQQTALHHAATRGSIAVLRELILRHNANMFVVDANGHTPFSLAFDSWSSVHIERLLEVYGNKLTQHHGSMARHKLLEVAEYSFAEDENFHPPLNPLRIILPVGMLTLKHLRYLLHTMGPGLVRNQDDTGKLPIHIACRTNAPVDVLALILELDPAVLHIADSTGALPIHLLCGTTAATEYAIVRYLVERGGVGTLVARNQQGASPLHVLCGSTDPPLQVVQYLIQSSPESLAVQTNVGQYPFMIAAAVDTSSASLSVIYELVRGDPNLVVLR